MVLFTYSTISLRATTQYNDDTTLKRTQFDLCMDTVITIEIALTEKALRTHNENKLILFLLNLNYCYLFYLRIENNFNKYFKTKPKKKETKKAFDVST